jgi:hypothetical protein
MKYEKRTSILRLQWDTIQVELSAEGSNHRGHGEVEYIPMKLTKGG